MSSSTGSAGQQISMQRAIAVPFPGTPRDIPIHSLSAQEKLDVTLSNLKNHHETVKSNIVEQAIAAKESIKERSINQPAQYTTELRKQTTNEIVASLQTRSKGTGNPVVKPPTYPEALLAFGRLPNDSPLKPIEEAVLNMTVYEMQAAKSIGDIYNKRRLADVHMTPSGIPTSSSTIPPAPSPSHNLPANTPTGPRAERGNEQVRTQSYDASRDPRLRR